MGGINTIATTQSHFLSEYNGCFFLFLHFPAPARSHSLCPAQPSKNEGKRRQLMVSRQEPFLEKPQDASWPCLKKPRRRFFLAFTYSSPRRPGLWNFTAMEKSAPLFQQVIGHKMLLVVFLFFHTNILVEGQAADPPDVPSNVSTYINTTTSFNVSSPPFLSSPKMTVEISMTSVTSTPDAALIRNASTAGPPALFLNATSPVSKQEMTPSAIATSTDAPEDTSSSMRSHVIVSTKDKIPRTEAAGIQDSTPPPSQKKAPSEMTVTPHLDSEKVTASRKDFRTRSRESSFEQSSSAIAYTEATKSTGPRQGIKGTVVPDQAVPELTDIPETGSHYTHDPFTTMVTSINQAPQSDSSDKKSSGKKRSIIILAVVFSILLLAAFLAFLYCRHRRHSGSTSFNASEWAGQATLPDDTGLDKDVEQGAGAAGEGETRRGTLVTFFGKRQSRVPSIAMEDVNGKGGKEETEQLLCEEAEIRSTSDGLGDANGKVPEALKQSPQASPASK